MDISIIIRAQNQASPELAKVADDIEKLTLSTARGTREAGVAATGFARNIRESTQAVQAMGQGVLMQLNPALAGAVSNFSMASREAMRMPAVLGGVTIAVAAAGAALSVYIDRLKESQQFQAQLNTAAASGDIQGIRSLARQATAQQELYNVQVRQSVQELSGWRAMLDVIVSYWQTAGTDADKFTEQISKAGKEIEKLVPFERERVRLQEELKRLQLEGVRHQSVAERAVLENDADRYLAANRELTGLLRRVEAATERLIATEGHLKILEAMSRQAPAAELAAINAETEQRLKTARAQSLTGFTLQGEAYRRGSEGIDERRIQGGLPNLAGYTEPGNISPEDITRTRDIVRAADQRDLQTAIQRMDILRETVDLELQREGLSAREREDLERSVVLLRAHLEIEKSRAEIDKAAGTTAEQAVREQEQQRQGMIRRREEIELSNIDYRRAVREDPYAGFVKGLKDAEEEFGASGVRMQSLARNTASSMAQAFDDGLFSVLTGDFKKLESVGTDFGRSILRNITRELSQYAVSAALSPLRQGLGQIFGPSGGGAGGPFPGTDGSGYGYPYTTPPFNPNAGAVYTNGAPTTIPTGAALLPQTYTGTSPIPTSGGPVASFLARPVLGRQSIAAQDAELQALVNSGAMSPAEADAFSYRAGGRAATGAGFTYGQAVGVAAGAAGLGLTVYGATQQPTTTESVVTSGVSGAVFGAQIGSQFGGYGTAIGAALGAILGAGAAAFFGQEPKKPSASERSAKRAAEAQSALSEALGKVTLLEEAVAALNAQYSGARELIVHAGARNATGAGEIFPEAAREGEAGHRLFREQDFFERGLLESLEAQTGATGQAARDERLTEMIQGQVEEILRREAAVRFQYKEPATAGGGVTRTTQLPFTRRSEAQGRDIDVLADQLLRMPEADKAKFLVALARTDRDHDIGIFKLDDSQIITLGRFTHLPDPVTPVSPDVGNPGGIRDLPGFLDPENAGDGGGASVGGAGGGAGGVSAPGVPGGSPGAGGGAGSTNAGTNPGLSPAEIAALGQIDLGLGPVNPSILTAIEQALSLLGISVPTALGIVSPAGVITGFQAVVGLAGMLANQFGVVTSHNALANLNAALNDADPNEAEAAANAVAGLTAEAVAAGMGLTTAQAAFVMNNPGLFNDEPVFSDPEGLGGLPGQYTTVGPGKTDFGDSPSGGGATPGGSGEGGGTGNVGNDSVESQ